MTQHFQLDSHKLQYHPRLVADYLDGVAIVPLNAEISITDGCNHRCLFCNFNYLGHKRVDFPHGRMPSLVGEMADAGVKTMTFGGAGEPLLHPDVLPALRVGYDRGMDLAMSTNGVLLKSELMPEVADMLTWIRFSINGGTAESYAAVHKCGGNDFDTVMRHLNMLAETKQRRNSPITIGTQCVLVEENRNDIEILGKRVKEAGADYFVVKHFYPREEGAYHPDMAFRDEPFMKTLDEIAGKLSEPSFSMIIRDPTKLERKRTYDCCYGLPFLVYIGENGLLYTCFSHHEDARTAVGSVVESDFLTVWNSTGCNDAINHINNQYIKSHCQANCRHHQINQWLWQLKHPPAHVNFI